MRNRGELFGQIGRGIVGVITLAFFTWLTVTIVHEEPLKQFFGGLFLLLIPVAVLYATIIAPWLRKHGLDSDSIMKAEGNRWNCEHTNDGDWDSLGIKQQYIVEVHQQAHRDSKRLGEKPLAPPPPGWDTGFTTLLRRAKRRQHQLIEAGLEPEIAEHVVYRNYLTAQRQEQGPIMALTAARPPSARPTSG